MKYCWMLMMLIAAGCHSGSYDIRGNGQGGVDVARAAHQENAAPPHGDNAQPDPTPRPTPLAAPMKPPASNSSESLEARIKELEAENARLRAATTPTTSP